MSALRDTGSENRVRVAGPVVAPAARPGRVPGAALALAVALPVFLASCSPDLRETAGPLVPIPNVQGGLLRNGMPVVRRKVKLEDSDTGVMAAKTRTDPAGQYGFAGVGTGRWTIKVASTDTTEFATSKLQLSFSRPDTSCRVPDLDVSLAGLRPTSPAPGDSVAAPTFTQPVSFQWSASTRTFASAQIRVYDGTGTPVWYSAKTTHTEANWNGRGSVGTYTNQPAPPGAYTWRVRMTDPASNADYTTTAVPFTLKAALP